MRQINNSNILIAVKSPKMMMDIQKYLINYFVKADEGKGFYEEKLKFLLNSHKEYARREALVSQKRDCNTNLIEAFYQHKLSLLLEQKLDW